jgi:hypothetical protein
VYHLKITELTAQRDMQSLVKILLRMPGLKPDQVSAGLRVPPLGVFSTEKEEDAQKLKSVLEKFGAVCAIENTEQEHKTEQAETPSKDNKDYKKTSEPEIYPKHRRHIRIRYRWKFWFTIFSILGIFAFLTFYDSSDETKPNHLNQHKKQVVQTVKIPDKAPLQGSKNQKPTAASLAKVNGELKNDIVKNPYNANAWKTLAENLEKQGDTASAHRAKESHEKAVKAQMVLASIAKAFGNKVRVDITEDAVYNRTSYDFTDVQFYAEADKLRDSLNVKFPGKNLIIENYTSDNRLQRVQLNSVGATD